jgi:hypothetical protein
MKALEAQNKKNEAKVIQNQWTSVWSRADVQLTSPVIL